MKILNVAGFSFLLICCRDESGVRTEADAPESRAQDRAKTTTNAPPSETSTQTSADSATDGQVTCVDGPHRLCPTDEGTRDATFVAFRERLKDAVDEKNEAKLLELVDPKIHTSFGGDGGIAEFRKQWTTGGSESELWSVLGKIISLGGTFRGSGKEMSFWAPYVYSSWPESVDAFEHVAAIRAGVPVRERAAEDSKTVARVDWAILRILPSANTPKSGTWFRVRTPEDDEGWIHADDAHSPVGYRAGFSKRTGDWKMEALVAGD